ncbi:MAG TPA: hypothetical protein ENI34_09595 [candidate division WOR-3 bacterium]|uniref:SAM-dependent chlorinase/fluorinase n=1 Tax=candidate division WOR-3 bacterium TaxID=2052148 RepID=A0A9C9EPZ2_UNCW3|nr:hypothetical protein [candidate division WOR-3 bacterium]
MITFISDFGGRDWFVAAVKGEIYRITKDAVIVDITHGIKPHDILSAAFVLKSVYRNFPKGTVHLVVVDPGVGGDRKPLIVESEGYYFVGPDNGVFSYIYKDDSKIYVIEVEEETSVTFHGRDIFAPAAARLSLGRRPDTFGRKTDGCKKIPFPVYRRENERIIGEVVYIDHFGNLITNIPNSVKFNRVYCEGKEISVKNFYEEGEPEEAICIKGSVGYYEIACNKGSAKDVLGAAVGTWVICDTVDDAY